MRRALAALPLLLAACASNEPPSSLPSTPSLPAVAETTSSGYYYRVDSDGGASVAEFDAPVEQVWSALMHAYGAAGIEIGSLDTKTRTMGNRAITTTRRLGQTSVTEYVRCAQGGSGIMNSTTYRVQMSVLSALRPTPNGGTRLETSLSATGTPVEGASRTATPCPSTGRLEQKLAESVRGALAG